MAEIKRDQLEDLDAGWDASTPHPGIARREDAGALGLPSITLSVPPRSGITFAPRPSSVPPGGTPADSKALDALDDGWNEEPETTVTETGTGPGTGIPSRPPSAFPPPSSLSLSVAPRLPRELETLDEGWGDEDDSDLKAPDVTPACATSPRRLNKKERRELERKLRAEQAKAEQQRRAARKERKKAARTEPLPASAEPRSVADPTPIQKATEARPAPNKKPNGSAKSRKRGKGKPVTAPNSTGSSAARASHGQASSNPKAPASSTAAAPNASASTSPTTTRSTSAGVPGWVLWIGLAAIVILTLYFVFRR